MAVRLDHTIMWVRSHEESAGFLAALLELPKPGRFGPFLVFRLANDVSLDLYEQGPDAEISLQHYAFRVDRGEYEKIFAGVKERGLEYWADPSRTRAGETYEFQGDRGFYVVDPNGHLLELITGL